MSKWFETAIITISTSLLLLCTSDNELFQEILVLLNWVVTMICAMGIDSAETKLNQRIKKLEKRGD